MSRTYNTMPYEVQEKVLEPWRFHSGYPTATGGAWPNRTKYARRRNRQYRQRTKLAIKLDKELPINVKCVSWDVW